jgi:hypothetical protein
MIEALIERIATLCEAWLAFRGHGPQEGDGSEDDTQAVLHAAAVAGRSAFEERRRRAQRVVDREVELPSQCAAFGGYTLHAGVSIGAKDREGLERLCRYVLRPPLAKSRLVALDDGRVALVLRRPWSDGTTEKVFTREELVDRLAVLVPPRQSDQVLYHGVFAARSKLRAMVVLRLPLRPKVKRLVRRERRSKRRGRWEPWRSAAPCIRQRWLPLPALRRPAAPEDGGGDLCLRNQPRQLVRAPEDGFSR